MLRRTRQHCSTIELGRTRGNPAQQHMKSRQGPENRIDSAGICSFWPHGPGQVLSSLVSFLVQGSSSNWYGLSCPGHCSGSTGWAVAIGVWVIAPHRTRGPTASDTPLQCDRLHLLPLFLLLIGHAVLGQLVAGQKRSSVPAPLSCSGWARLPGSPPGPLAGPPCGPLKCQTPSVTALHPFARPGVLRSRRVAFPNLHKS